VNRNEFIGRYIRIHHDVKVNTSKTKLVEPGIRYYISNIVINSLKYSACISKFYFQVIVSKIIILNA